MKKRCFGKFIWLLALFSFFFFKGRCDVFAEDKSVKNVYFKWAFGAVVGSSADRKLIQITSDTTLKTGDQLKMLVELQKKCFVYVFYRNTKDVVHMLFPYDLKQFTSDYDVLNTYYIPKDTQWFELDENLGLETFYLLASMDRLKDLEKLYLSYVSADDSNKSKLANEILSEIRKTRKRYRKLKATVERPIRIGGNVRGTPKDALPSIDSLATEISATKFYGRTFTIDHK